MTENLPVLSTVTKAPNFSSSEMASNVGNKSLWSNFSEESNGTDDLPFVFTRGVYFEMTEKAIMRINIWPLIFVCIYSVLGVAGNSLVLYIYWLKWKKNKTRIFILCLAMLDWVNCAFNMPVEIGVLWHPLSFDLHYLCKITRGCTYVINNTGSLVLVSIAIDRYLLVYHPLKCRQLTPKFAKWMCVLAFVVALSVSWPSFIFYGSHTYTIPVDKHIVVKGKSCLIADEHKLRTGLILIFTTVLFALLILTFIVLTGLYIAIGRKIYLATCAEFATEKEKGVTRLFSRSLVAALTGIAQPDVSQSKNIFKYSFVERNSSMMGRNESSTNVIENTEVEETDNTTLAKKHSSIFETSKFIERNGSKISRIGSTISANESTDVGETDQLTLTKNQSPGSETAKPLKRTPRLSRKFSSVKPRATRKNTVMMRMVTIAFMLSFTPFLCILIIRYTNPNYYLSLNEPSKIAYQVFIRTYFINSMVNPFIYGFLDLHFRTLVKTLFRKLFLSKCCAQKA